MAAALRRHIGPRWRTVTVPCDQPLTERQAKVINLAWSVGRFNPKTLASQGDTIEQICSRIERRPAPGWPTSQMLRNARQARAGQDPTQPTFDDKARMMAWRDDDDNLIDDVSSVLYARWETKHAVAH